MSKFHVLVNKRVFCTFTSIKSFICIRARSMATSNGQPSIKDMMGKMNGKADTSPAKSFPKPKKKTKTVEETYQKKTQLEHILLRPDTYIGSVEKIKDNMWVVDKETEAVVQREITYVPGLYKIFDEILVNAADHKQRDPKMDSIKVDIDQENNQISIWNNGVGIPVANHKGENMMVPTMIFGHLLTSSNYDDEEQKVTGGRNGYGAKLCNIFSTKFTVETYCKQHKKHFKQVWGNNMSKASEPKIKEFTGTEFTKISFSPDLEKFKMESLDDDIVSLLSRRAYDIAAVLKGVKVWLNGKKLPFKGFKDYVDIFLKDKEDDMGNPVKSVYEVANERWEIAVALSDKGYQNISFVNSIATAKGGRHVDYAADMVVKNIIETLKKKNKSGVTIKPFQIKNHLWIFLNCQIVNPTFDSQTKENMTLQAKNFGSKLTLSDKFSAAVTKCGIVESVMSWAKFKQQAQLQAKCAGKKQTKLRGIPKLEDANNAGTKNSSLCTLILTEGDSAKSLAVAGLGVVGRDNYGVFPLKGKLLNVREASHKQILENAEINHVIQIMGLQYKRKYDTSDDLKTLRYGKLMIMTDQDQDGSHIKGLLINFIHHNWPSLLNHAFLEEFITPIVKATKGNNCLSFYSLPEMEQWKLSTDDWHKYRIKYYKGLGTSSSKEAKEYFTDMARHKIKFEYNGTQDDHSINLAFSRKFIEQRKEWLTKWMEQCKRRKELGLADIYLYEKDTKSVNYSDFVNKELVLFSNMDNERSIPSIVDGLKPGQRKVMFACFKSSMKREEKVAQLAAQVAKVSAYHHGEASLMGTIINLAQNYVGSNNINLLQPIGQFGTRLQGGKDSASPRYIFTALSPLARHIFNPCDDAIYKYLYDDNDRIEPEWYVPILPMVLVNGAEGIGTGWSTKIPNYNPRDIVANLRRMINGEEPKAMIPWYKNFRGEIELLDHQRYVCHGEISRMAYNKFEITELPIKVWTQSYKESVIEAYRLGSDKMPALVSDYREYHTDTTVRFVVTIPEDKTEKIDHEGPHRVFKLQGSIPTSSMVLFDHNGVIRKYETELEILTEFFEVRTEFYIKRKSHMMGMLEAEAAKLSNQARFILEKCDGKLTIENKKRKDMIAELLRKGFESDPIKAYRLALDKNALKEEQGNEEEVDENINEGGPDYDYLLGMAMWNLTKERKDEILKNKDKKFHELEVLKGKTPSKLWIDDLDAFMDELKKLEVKEAEEEKDDRKAANKKSDKGRVKKQHKDEVMPSPSAERIVPKIDTELKKKAERAQQVKNKGTTRVKRELLPENDDFDDIVSENTGKSLANRVGSSPDVIAKQSKVSRVAAKPKAEKGPSPKKKRHIWDSDNSDEGGEISDVSASDNEIPVQPRERAGGRRAAAAKVKYDFSEEEQSEGELSLHSNDGVAEDNIVQEKMDIDDSFVVPKKEKAAPAVKLESDSDSDSDLPSPPSKVSESKKVANPVFEFDSDSDGDMPVKSVTSKKSDNKAVSKQIQSDSDSDRDVAVTPVTSKKPDNKAVSKQIQSDSDSESKKDKPSASDMFDSLVGSPPSQSNGNGKIYSVSSDSDDEAEPAPAPKPKPELAPIFKPKPAVKETKPKAKRGPNKKTSDEKPKKAAAAPKRKKNLDFSDDSDDFFEAPAKKVAPKKKKMNESSDDDIVEVASDDAGPRKTTGRSRPAKPTYTYNFSESEGDDY